VLGGVGCGWDGSKGSLNSKKRKFGVAFKKGVGE